MSGDLIQIRELKVATVVGIHDWEREVRQVVSLDIEVGADVRAAAATDDIDSALNYKTLVKRVKQEVEGRRFQLVETIAEAVAALVLEEFEVKWVRVRASKPGAVRGALDVGALIERGER